MGNNHAHNQRDLPTPREPDANAQSPRQVLSFSISGQRFAVDILAVRGITPAPGLTRVPGSRPEITGIANLRGQIVPVLSIRRTLGLTDTHPDKHARLILLEHEGRRAAFIADRVHEVLKIDAPTLSPGTPDSAEANRGFILGIAPQGPVRLIVLDTDRLLDSLDHAENRHAAEAA